VHDLEQLADIVRQKGQARLLALPVDIELTRFSAQALWDSSDIIAHTAVARSWAMTMTMTTMTTTTTTTNMTTAMTTMTKTMTLLPDNLPLAPIGSYGPSGPESESDGSNRHAAHAALGCERRGGGKLQQPARAQRFVAPRKVLVPLLCRAKRQGRRRRGVGGGEAQGVRARSGSVAWGARVWGHAEGLGSAALFGDARWSQKDVYVTHYLIDPDELFGSLES